MAEAGEGKTQHPVESLDGAVVRVLAPADVGEMAGDAAQPAAPGAAAFEQRGGPVEQRLAGGAEPGFAGGQLDGGGERRVGAALAVGELRIEETLAQALGGKRHPSRPRRGQRRLHQRAGQRQAGAPSLGDSAHPPQRLRAENRGQPGDVGHSAGGNGMAVDHVQRMAGMGHVQPRHRPPRPADRVEVPPLRGAQPVDAGERLVDPLQRVGGPLPVEVGEAQDAERQGRLAQHASAADLDQLEAPAAEVADDPLGAGHPPDHAEGRDTRLVLAAQDVDALAAGLAHPVGEVAPVGRLAHRRGGDQRQPADLHPAGEPAEPRDGIDRRFDGRVAQPVGMGEVAAEGADRALVEHRLRRPRPAVIDDEPDRIGADVDDPDRLAGLRRRASAGPGDQPGSRAPPLRSALPRPDRLGLVMKYAWAEKASPPAAKRR